MELFAKKENILLPLARRAAPAGLGEFAGQRHLVGPDAPIRCALEAGRPFNAIFFGPPGCGKTALARVMAKGLGLEAVEISCVTTGVPVIRQTMEAARLRHEGGGKPTFFVLDEIHHLNRTQQDILLPYMESGAIALIGLTTENPFFYIHRAVLSRALVYEFNRLEDEDLDHILKNGLELCAKEGKDLRLDREAARYLVRFASGDARKLMNALEFLAGHGGKGAREGEFKRQDLERLLGLKQLTYDKKEDSHYDTASAFIKAMRGSDPDATVYWLAKMIA
ncbi:MAG: AAA family ATPase, partial [Elusimicrobiota bacterium]